jgi:hypothetical protein
MKLYTALAALLFTLPSLSPAEEDFKLGGVVLLQPDSVMAPRVRSVEDLAAYVREIESATKRHFKLKTKSEKKAGFVVVAVKPKQQSNVWFDFTPTLPPAESRELTVALRKVVPMQVTGGPVVFALQLGIGGGEPPTAPMPRPEEWVTEVQKAGHPIETGELVLRVWRE